MFYVSRVKGWPMVLLTAATMHFRMGKPAKYYSTGLPRFGESKFGEYWNVYKWGRSITCSNQPYIGTDKLLGKALSIPLL